MDHQVPGFDVNIDPAGFVVDLGSLYEHLATLTDCLDVREALCALYS